LPAEIAEEYLMALSTIPLPNRDVAVRSGVISIPSAYYFSTPVLLVLAALFIFWQTPSLLHDIVISKNPLPLPDASMQDARCKTYRGFIVDCEAHLSYDYKGRHYESDTEMMFADFHFGDYQTGVVISADKPELATLSIGIDKLWDRIITFVVLVVILGGMGLGMIWLLIRIIRTRRALRQPARLTVIPVEISASNKNRAGFAVAYADKIADRRTGRVANTQFARGEQPLLVGVSKDNKAVALAVRHGDTALPVLLDSQLQRIELTPGERQAALAVTQPVTASAPSLESFAVRKRGRPFLRALVSIVVVLALFFVGLIGYWLWYVTSAPSAFNSPGMDINNIMPAPLNKWGCEQLSARFPGERMPFGCVPTQQPLENNQDSNSNVNSTTRMSGASQGSGGASQPAK
jgi:hypothetical protein